MKTDDQKNVTGNGKTTANGGNANIAHKDVSGSLIFNIRYYLFLMLCFCYIVGKS